MKRITLIPASHCTQNNKQASYCRWMHRFIYQHGLALSPQNILLLWCQTFIGLDYFEITSNLCMESTLIIQCLSLRIKYTTLRTKSNKCIQWHCLNTYLYHLEQSVCYTKAACCHARQCFFQDKVSCTYRELEPHYSQGTSYNALIPKTRDTLLSLSIGNFAL